MSVSQRQSRAELRAPGATQPANLSASTYRAHLFGPFQVFRDGQPLSGEGWGRTGARTLLKWFLLNPGVSYSQAELAGILAPDLAVDVGRSRVQVAVHYLRRCLEPELKRLKTSAFIHSEDGRYCFEPNGRWSTDVGDAERLDAQAKAAECAGDIAEAIDALERATAYFSLTFLPEDLYDDAFNDHRFEHEVAQEIAQNRLLALYLAAGLNHKAMRCGLAILERDPCSDVAALAIAKVHLREGNPTAATRQLVDHRRRVHRELGIAPGEPLRVLEHKLRRRSSIGASSSHEVRRPAAV